MNLPNRLTCLRIALSVVFLFLLFLPGALYKALALAAFFLATYTDYLDGKIARARNLITAFGRLMDPIADKILTLSAFLSFVQMGVIPAWMAVAIISRDVLITSFRLALPPAGGDRQSARTSGKHKTALQFAAIVGILLYLWVREMRFWRPEWSARSHDVIYIGMLFVVAVTLWSGVRYVWKSRDLLR